jgi:UDP-N-acetylmuramoylalanine--D-glutamate ligase
MGEAAYQMSAPTLIASTAQRVVVGLGVTGLSVARFLHQRGEPFTIVDNRAEPPGLAPLLAEMPEVPLLLGDWHPEVLLSAGELVVSPGIALEEPAIAAARDAAVPVCGDIDLFMAAARAPVIGITGSNAKSTVTALVGEMAAAAGLNVGVGGNLGTAALDLLDDARDLYVLELSSFQLERAGELGLAVATVLNISEDHLDRHGSLQRYHQAKHRIFAGAGALVCNAADPLTIPPQVPGRRAVTWRLGEPDLGQFGLRREDDGEYLVEGFERLLRVQDLAMPGRHNVANALAALALGRSAGLPTAIMLDVLRGFRGLPHRCELVGESGGVRWVNDSKATNVGAALAAIEGLGADHPLLLIAGGRDKQADFRKLRPAVARHCVAVFLIGEAAPLLAAALEGACDLQVSTTLEAAVRDAAARARPGDLVLLSPACASFDQFSSYEARGAAFAAAARREALP